MDLCLESESRYASMQVSQPSHSGPPAADASDGEHMEYLKRQIDSMMGKPICQGLVLRDGANDRLQGGAQLPAMPTLFPALQKTIRV